MSQQAAVPARSKQAKGGTSGGYRAWPGPAILAGGAYQDGPLLANRLGLQLARIATVNAAWKLRRRPVAEDLKPYVEAYERDGVVVLENFLPADVFERVRAETLAAYEEGLFTSEVADDNNVIEERLGLKNHRDRFPVTWEALGENELVKRLAAAILRRPSVDRLRLDANFMTKSQDAPAPERLVGTNYLHADVHYPSGKAWLYLNDIDEENGAFVYAKGSQRLSLARLAHEYDVSVRVAKARRAGSFYSDAPANLVRMPTEQQIRAMGIREEAVCGPANTLVFADVMGFHKRGEFAEGRRREQIMVQFFDRPPVRKKG
jgi:hypothetical protein